MRLDVVRMPADQTLADYLNSGWMENVDKGSIEEVTINGFRGATATANGDQWRFRVYALRFGSDVYRFIFAAKNKTPELDRQFRESVQSFRRMSNAEARAARPLRLKVVTVTARRHDRAARRAHGGVRQAGGALPRAERPRSDRQAEARRYGQADPGVTRGDAASPRRFAADVR